MNELKKLLTPSYAEARAAQAAEDLLDREANTKWWLGRKRLPEPEPTSLGPGDLDEFVE